MKQKIAIKWLSLAGVVGILFGIFYALYGLGGLPAYHKLVSKDVFGAWSNGLYGAVFIGFSTLLFFVSRHAFQQNDKILMKILLYGIGAWLSVEALFSLYYGVYFNVGVDIALASLLGYPLIRRIQT